MSPRSRFGTVLFEKVIVEKRGGLAGWLRLFLMGKGTKWKSGSHQIFKDRAKSRVEDLQVLFTYLQCARKESCSADVSMYEEQLNQMLKEWKNEFNQPSHASSLQQGGSMDPYSPYISRLLQLCEEEDDATSGLAAPKPDRDGRKAGENAAFHEEIQYY